MKISESAAIVKEAIAQHQPTHIVSMVSGGKDSAASDQIARELGIKIDMVIHGRTRCGIPETSHFVEEHYGHLPDSDFAVADAGSTYEDYVLRKGFFGKGVDAHAFAYRVLKAQPFRKVISKAIRHGKRGVRVLLLNGARKDESENRQANLQPMRADPASPGNLWVNTIHDWTQEDRDTYLESRQTQINPVAVKLCRSGECMCGTMQSSADRVEAAFAYPAWARWLDALEKAVVERHGFGWNDQFPKLRKFGQLDMFMPMCADCNSSRPVLPFLTTTDGRE